MKNIERYMRHERKECLDQRWRDRCALTVTMQASGEFCARLAFQPGMESVAGRGDTVEGALAALNELLN